MSFDYQATLLDYYVTQSVAHGAMLFSAVLATFYFFNLISRRNELASSKLSGWKAFFVFLLSGLFVGFCIFALGRLVVYGMLSQYALNTDATKSGSLLDYSQQVVNKTRTDKQHPFWLVFAIYASSSNILWVRFFVSYAVGLFGSLAILIMFDSIEYSSSARSFLDVLIRLFRRLRIWKKPLKP